MAKHEVTERRTSEEYAIEYIAQNLDSYTAKQLSALIETLDQVKQEQRKECSEEVEKAAIAVRRLVVADVNYIKEACLNATGKENE